MMMHRSIWALAGIGIVGVMLSVGAADERFFGKEDSPQRPAPRAKIEYFSRGGKPAAQPSDAVQTPQVKNYYNDLFGEKGGTSDPAVMHAEFDSPAGDETSRAVQQMRATANDLAPVRPSFEPTQPPAPTNKPQALAFPATPKQNSLAKSAQSPAAKSTPKRVVPSGSQTPVVKVVWDKGGEINVGQASDCLLVVKNTGSLAADDVEVDAFFPNSVRLAKTQPEPHQVSDHLTWKFAQLAPGEQQEIHVTLIPSRAGAIETSARVRFTGSSAGSYVVTEPKLAVSVQGPNEVAIGEPASQLVTVTNPGSGIARNVTVEAKVPSGLEHARGERLVMEIGALNAGESRDVRLPLLAIAGGRHHLNINVTAKPELTATTESDVFVVAPVLKLAVDGPGLRYVGRSAKYKLTITNSGAAVSSNVSVMHRVPEGFEFENAGQGGKFDSTSRVIKWYIGRIEPGHSAVMEVKLKAKTIGEFVHHVGAISEHGARAEDKVATAVDGTASLVLEIVDLDDPVEIGSDTGYEIRVRNDGTKSAQDVGVSCELANAVDLVDASGPTGHINENGLVVFKSLGELATGESVVYRVRIRGRLEGNHRFRVRLASKSITEPLIFEELTKFYAE